MANEPTNGILFRDGQSNRTRALPALDPAHFSVEEHTAADLIRLVQAYARELKFFELDGTVGGDWSGFLTPPADWLLRPEDMLAFYRDPEGFAGTAEQREWLTRPHFVLFMAFLEMLEEPKAQLDDLTRRHLDFYFRRVLGFRPRAFEPDRVHVCFEPARGVQAHRLPAGALLHAGKDAGRKDRQYATADDLLITRARVADIRRMYQEKTGGKIYADVSWREGEKVPPDHKYQALGADLSGKSGATAELGFAISSPLLDLSEGARTITLIITFAPNAVFPDELTAMFRTSFRYEVSTEKGWLVISVDDIAIEEQILERKLTINVQVRTGLPAVTAWPGGTAESFPALKASLNSDAPGPETLQNLLEMQVERMQLTVSADGLTNPAIRNDEGLLNPKGTFFPFGSWPITGSAFAFAHRELSGKPLREIKLDITWKGKPPSLKEHYAAYDLNLNGDEDFKARLKPSDAGETAPEPLFRLADAANAGEVELTFGNLNLGSVQAQGPDGADPLDFPRYFKLVLGNPDFQHDNFAKTLIKHKGNPDAVNPPYTPEVQTLSLAYTSGVQTVQCLPGVESVHRFYHLHPFGYAAPCLPVDAGGRTPLPALLPQPGAAGNLFIGLAGAVDTTELSLLLQLLPGTTEKGAPIVQWSYLDRHCWKPLDETRVLTDRTRNLLNAGLVRLRLPPVEDLAHTILPAGLYWLRASAAENVEAAGELIAVHAQAAEAVWQDNGNAALHLAQPLPAESIRELVRRDPAIRSVKQPYTSFGGRLPEPDAGLYARAAERLRHKQRALTAWDYERLVLDRFPELYKVKCLQHWEKPLMEEPAYNDPADGKVVLIAIPDLANRAPFFPLQPRISNELKNNIETYVQTLVSPFAAVEVRNPRFEYIRYRLDIRFRTGYEDEYYRQEANRALQRFLSPWAYEAGADIGFGSRIYHAEVIYFLEKLPYVDYVVNFKLARQYLDKGDEYGCIGEDRGYASARYPDSILVSHWDHLIGTVLTDDYDPARFKGVGYDRIGVDLGVYG